MTQQTYARLQDLALTLATEGHTIIADATYTKRHYRQTLRELALNANLPFQILHCTAPTHILQQRLNTLAEALKE